MAVNRLGRLIDTAMTEEPREYISYLLRLWKASGAGLPAWRASLEDPHTHERKGFADLKSLFVFLEEETGDRAQQTGRAPEPDSFDPSGDMPMN